MAEQNLDRFYKNPYLFNAKELDRETGLYYYGARYYNPKLSIWYGVDPLAERHSEASPYVYVLNNPIYYIDPDGNTEYPSYAAYQKAMGSKALSRRDMWKQGHWLTSDRTGRSVSIIGHTFWSGRTSVFNNAAVLNTFNGRSGDYVNLAQRKAYYDWAEEFYNDKRYEVRWFTAAKDVVGGLQDALLFGKLANIINDSYGTNDRINAFIKAGNKVILDDVMSRIADLLASGGVLTGADAKVWDSQTLSNEQNAIQPLYNSMLNSEDIVILKNNIKMKYNATETLWEEGWSVDNASHRWALGMRVMGYEGTKPEEMPKPTN